MTFQKILKKKNRNLKLVKYLKNKDIQKINKQWELNSYYIFKQNLKYFLTRIFGKFNIRLNFNSLRQLENVEKKYNKIAGSYIQKWNSKKNNYIGYWTNNKVAEISGLHMYSTVNILSEIIKLKKIKSFLEVGAGEMTTLCGILKNTNQKKNKFVAAIDISLNRLIKGARYLKNQKANINHIARADVTELPFEENTFELVFSNYCFEQCPQLFDQGLKEMIRVTKKYIVLIEPSYEFSEKSSKNKIISKGYIRLNNKRINNLFTNIIIREPMPYSRYINRGEIIILSKKQYNSDNTNFFKYVSPIFKTKLNRKKNFYFSSKENIKFPIHRNNIALLTKFDAIKTD